MANLGYFKMYSEKEKFLGGIMVVTEKGIPIEFKYTDIIEPTKLQKVLYGDVLKKYLREEVIMGNLVAKLENKPDIYMVGESEDLVLKNYTENNVMFIRETQLNSRETKGDYQFIKESEAIIQLHETGSPIRAEIHSDNKNELVEKLINLNVEANIFEPFLRVEEALTLICKGDL